MSSISSTPKNSVCVAVVGVGLVGSEFINQLLSFPKPSPFRIVSLSRSKTSLFHPEGLAITPTSWKSELSKSLNKLDFQGLIRELSGLVTPNQKVVLVDNTSSEDIARLYSTILKFGIEIITPNKKAYSGDLKLYESILSAGLDSGARLLNEATVGAGLPIISTLKDLVATGDKVSTPVDIAVVVVLRLRQIVKIEGVFSGTMSYIFNEFSTGQSNGPSFSSVVSIAREKGYTEPHPADDLNGADVARKLTILSRYIPSLRSSLPEGYKSVSTTSLVPTQLEGVATGDEFIQKLPEFDSHFQEMREQAAKEGKVLRFVGVVDVQSGTIKADLEKWAENLYSSAKGSMLIVNVLLGIPIHTHSPPHWEVQITSSCSIQSDTAPGR
jgi:homoserine dehydrogenase